GEGCIKCRSTGVVAGAGYLRGDGVGWISGGFPNRREDYRDRECGGSGRVPRGHEGGWGGPRYRGRAGAWSDSIRGGLAKQYGCRLCGGGEDSLCGGAF